jgi:hypothetical protein
MTRYVAIGAFILSSCHERGHESQSSTQINMDSLLNYHVNQLTKSKVHLSKVSNINNHISTTELSEGRVNWTTEFDSFRAIASINKPIHSSSYNIKVDADKKSNLLVKTWQTEQKLPLKKLKIYFLKDYSRIKRLEASVEQHNFVFSSTKEFSIDFSVLGMHPIIDLYRISGYQKFFWEEPQYFSLEGHIHLK